MAGLQSVVPLLPLVSQGVGLVSRLVASEASAREKGEKQKLALQQLQRRQAEDFRRREEDAALERAQISARAAEAERERRSALKRAVARQRSRFGGSGVSGAGGSAEAVLLGLFEESDAQRAQRERLDNLRFGALDQNLEQRKSLNILQREQLRQKQNINNLSSTVERVSDGLDFGIGALDLAGSTEIFGR